MSGLQLHDSFEPYYSGRDPDAPPMSRFAFNDVRRRIEADPRFEQPASVEEIEAERRTDADRPPR